MITLENVTKIFGSNYPEALRRMEEGKSSDEIREKTGCTVAVREINLQIQKEKITVIMGLSGSGKSTLLRCINRLVKPTSGNVYLDIGEEGKILLSSLSYKKLLEIRRNHMAMVFQNFGLFPRKTVLENVCFGLSLQKKDNIQETAMEALRLVGLHEWIYANPSQLSGGMQQRVGLARALATNVEILLMDEAFSALDPLIRQNMQGELLSLQKKLNKTIVFVSHDLAEALRIGDHIIIMQDGQFVQTGEPEAIIINPKTDYVKNFVKGADPSNVVTAKTIMSKKSHLVQQSPHGYSLSEDDKTYLFQVTENNKLQNIIFNDTEKLSVCNVDEKGIDEMSSHKNSILTFKPNVFVKTLTEAMLHSKHPLVILSNDSRFQGVITKKNLLNAVLKRFDQ
jgi:glycine betaine/proline transport system ATP-binding protein